MTHNTETVWPPLESGYRDAEGWVDLEVYRTAAALWPFAEQLARNNLHDSMAGQKLMLKAVVNVSSALEVEQKSIRNLKGYLFVTYKRLLLEELNKRRKQEESDARELRQSAEAERRGKADDLERKILVQELVQRMDGDMRYVFERLILGYTFEEIAAEQNTPSNILRNRYHRMLKRLVKQIEDENRAEEG
jgi:DNA-directed RNA polymerase specialized sigma24 family protein